MNELKNLSICCFCGSSLTKVMTVKEMRHGTREEFAYTFCQDCESLFLNNIPETMGKYYTQYYTSDKEYNKLTRLSKVFWRIRSFLSVYGFYWIINSYTPNALLKWIHKCKLGLNDRILDVGCGKGDILFTFHKHGFNNLYGVDPFPPNNIDLDFGWSFTVGNIFDVKERNFDLIMFNHSLEHMTEHESVLAKAKELLGANGKILIRMPIINNAFYKYQENWVQIDAPRHFFIYSLKSFSMLCERLGFLINDVFYDSTEFQFLGSEQNSRDISFFDKRSYKITLSESIFSDKDIRKYKRMASEYNKKGFGDQVGFILESNKN